MPLLEYLLVPIGFGSLRRAMALIQVLHPMQNKYALLLVCFSSFSVALLPRALGPTQDPTFVVRDSSGRIRMTSFEKDGCFGLKLLDDKGGDGIVLRCWGGGESAIDMYGVGDRVMVHMGRRPGDGGAHVSVMSGEKGGAVSMVGRDDGGCMLAMRDTKGDGRGELICALDAEGTSVINMVQGRGASEQTLSLHNGTGGKATGPTPGGLVLSRGGSRVGGFLVEGDSGVAWFGDDAMGGNENWRGARLGWGRDKGAFMEVRQAESSHGVRIQDFLKEGSGVQVGKSGRELVRFGIGSSGPKVVLANEQGVVVQLPK